MIEKPVTKSDSATQTDTHILEPNIVKSYEWNEWELRRKAIKLVRTKAKCVFTDRIFIPRLANKMKHRRNIVFTTIVYAW